jgi:predicted dehydrogenase
MDKVKAILLGAGHRGMFAYGPYAIDNPEKLQFVAVADQDADRREQFRILHGINEDMCFSDWEELLGKDRMADAVLICTQDKMHYGPALKALKKGYHVLLEKPMSPDPLECVEMGEYAKKYNRIFSICHVLRYTDFFKTIKKLLVEGRIGKVISIQHNENVGFWHQAHSFVRGNWRNSEESSPMILSKCCHDMDIMLWLADADCISISSFGKLTHFKKDNAPEGAPLRCLDGCPVQKECIYYAPNTYLTDNLEWPTCVISSDLSYEARERALKEGPYGRCVYHCDNNVVDHQVVNIQFANDITASFTMCAFSKECSRTIKIMGTKGEIRGAMEKKDIEVIDFSTGETEKILLDNLIEKSGHGGGDAGIMRDFVKLIQNEADCKSLTSGEISVQSHMMSFAAEKSRLENKIINIQEYTNELKRTRHKS